VCRVMRLMVCTSTGRADRPQASRTTYSRSCPTVTVGVGRMEVRARSASAGLAARAGDSVKIRAPTIVQPPHRGTSSFDGYRCHAAPARSDSVHYKHHTKRHIAEDARERD